MKKALLLIATTIILFNMISLVSAAAIGVNKGEMNFLNVLRGGYAEDSVIISTDVTHNMTVDYRITGDIEGWVRFEPEELIMKNGNHAELTVIIEPPVDTSNGVYEGTIELLTSPLTNFGTAQMGSSILTAFSIKVSSEVTGRQVSSCRAAGFDIKDAEISYPLEFYSTIVNTGNVRISPDYVITIWDQEQKEVLFEYEFRTEEELLPTTTKTLYEQIDVDLDIGQYWAEVSSPDCGDVQLLTFNVVERGEIADKGELIRIEHPSWVKTGDIVPITASFRNMGTRYVATKLKGLITLEDNIIKIIDTDLLDVAPGQTVQLETFFSPKVPGKYEISLRALYNNKLTFEKQSLLNVNPSDEFSEELKKLQWKNTKSILLIIIVIIILLFLILIKKKKSRRKKIF